MRTDNSLRYFRRDFFMTKNINKQLIYAGNVKKSYGEKVILDFEELTIYQGEKIGLVGLNGAGKTTLMNLLSGETEQDQGDIIRRCEISYFKQFDELSDIYEIDTKELKEMKIAEQAWQENVSGGEGTRIRLAKALGSGKPVLFADEPTSNLDMKGIELVKNKLKKAETLVIISHDRDLLNALCTRIVEVRDSKLYFYDGNYDDYVQIREENLARQWTEYESYTSEKKRLTEVYRQKKEKAKTLTKRPKGMSAHEAGVRNLTSRHPKDAKQRRMEAGAKNVLNRIEHMEKKEKPKELPPIRPDFRLTNPPENKIVIEGRNIVFAYDTEEVLRGVDFEIKNGSRVAIVGDNGCGKTTLLKIIRDEFLKSRDIKPELPDLKDGSVRIVPKAVPGFFEQDFASLDYDRTVLENIMKISIQKEDIARMILARLLLTRTDIDKKASVLSGGERIKLSFARLFVSDANVLVLDEPTNYLDIPSVEALEAMFSQYEGTMIFVSHDRAFINAVATDIIMIENGIAKSYHGNLDEYEEYLNNH